MEDETTKPIIWSGEQERVIAWLALPKSERVPKTQKALAAEIGIYEDTICRWKRLPGWGDAVNALALAYVKDDIPDVLAVIRREAKRANLPYVNMVLSMAGLSGQVEAAGKGPTTGVVIHEVIVERPGDAS